MKFENVYLHDFTNRVDVECAQCGKRALVKTDPQQNHLPRFSCLHCGLIKEWDGNLGLHATGSLQLEKNAVHTGRSSDPYFGFTLWYQTICCGHTFWAYNERHLQFYENYIGDKLRKRSRDKSGWSNQSLQSRMPRWMLSAKNREVILKKIRQLKEK